MIFYYSILLLFVNFFASTSFILDPIFLESSIDCLNDIYVLNSMKSSSNVTINNNLYLNIFLTNDQNTIVFNNNNTGGIEFINLPIKQIGNCFLVLNNENILGIYNSPQKTKNTAYYDGVEVKNIISDKYQNFLLNNTDKNLNIGNSQSTNTIDINGNINIISENISTTNSNNLLILSVNQSENIHFDNDISVLNTVNCSQNLVTFENLNINSVSDSAFNAPLGKNTIFMKNLKIYGSTENRIVINILFANGILNLNNQDFLISSLSSSNINNFIQIDENGNTSCINLPLPQIYNTIINTNSDKITIQASTPNSISITPANNNNHSVLQINTFELDTFFVYNKKNNFFFNNCSIKRIDFDTLQKFINGSENITISLIDLNPSSTALFNNKVILNSKNIYFQTLDSYLSNNTLGFNTNGVLCIQDNNSDEMHLFERINVKHKNYTIKKNSLLYEIETFKKNKNAMQYDDSEDLEVEMKKKLYDIIKEIK